MVVNFADLGDRKLEEDDQWFQTCKEHVVTALFTNILTMKQSSEVEEKP
jgi:hypothetical protein